VKKNIWTGQVWYNN